MSDLVKVKPLEWHKSHMPSWNGDFHTFPTAYTVRCADEYGWKWAGFGAIGNERSPAEAQAAAQADYAARILAALDLTAVEAMQAENKRLRNILGRIRDHIDDGTEEGHVQLDYIGTQMVDMLDDIRAEVERLTAANREAAMQAISDGAQTQEALERAVAAEADRDRPLRALLDEALNLTVRGRRLDGIARRQNHLDASVNPEEWQASGRFDDFVARHNATREPWEQIEVRSLTPQLWTEDQFQRDLHDWETRARATLAKIGDQHD